MPNPLQLVIGREYIFIDSLYVRSFAEAAKSVVQTNDLRALRSILPSDYALFTADSENFDISRISYFEDSKETTDSIRQFCSDTGLIVVVDTEVFFEVAASFNYDDLVDSLEVQSLWFVCANSWTTLAAEYAGRLYYFDTSEISEDLTGGGDFLIT